MSAPMLQFKQCATQSGREAYEAYSAIWSDNVNQVVIASPTLAALKISWKKITGKDLDSRKGSFDRIWIINAEEKKDAK